MKLRLLAAHLLLCSPVPNRPRICGPGVGDPCPREISPNLILSLMTLTSE